MRRQPEPELMDEPAQARAYADADFSEPNQLFLDSFAARFPGFTAGLVVDLGCGPADIPIRFARHYPGAELVAVDGAPAMLALARRAISRSGVANQIRTVAWRLGQQPVPGSLARRGSAVISNSLLHHLAEPATLWRAIWDCGAGDAVVAVMDLLRPPSRARARQLVATYADGAPPVLQRDFYNSLLAAYSLQEVRGQLKAADLNHFDVASISDRHWLAWGRLPGELS